MQRLANGKKHYFIPARPNPEKRLWCTTFAILIADSRLLIESGKAKEPHHNGAFYDIYFCGAITKRLCEKTDTEPVLLNERFRMYVQRVHSTRYRLI